MITRAAEVGEKVVERCANRPHEVRREGRPYGICRLDGTTLVVVQQDEGDVVPVLRLASGSAGLVHPPQPGVGDRGAGSG